MQKQGFGFLNPFSLWTLFEIRGAARLLPLSLNQALANVIVQTVLLEGVLMRDNRLSQQEERSAFFPDVFAVLSSFQPSHAGIL